MNTPVTMPVTTPVTIPVELPAVQFRSVGKRIDERPILDDIGIQVRVGETLAIAGVNGAGKTTLLRCMLDFMKVSTGQIDIFGIPSTKAMAREKLAFLPERFVPPGHLTGHETLVWLAGLRGKSWTKAESRAAFSEFSVDAQALERPLKVFSKGMTQKIGLMACLLTRAPLIVLDEPMSGLDPQARRFFCASLERAKADGRTIILTSHAMHDIEKLADRMVVIHGGRIEFNGSPADLRKQHGGASLEESFLQRIDAKESA